MFRIIFAGTPDFAVPALDALSNSPHEILEVWTQPDRPAGRGRKLRASPVKRRALELGQTLAQPASLKPPLIQSHLAALAPDLVIVVAYGLILPPALLAAPKHGCLNIHASLLPRWRGAAPIQRAILAGDHTTGVSIMRMEAGLDTGPVLTQRETAIEPRDSAQTLHDRLADMGAAALLDALDNATFAFRHALHQDGARATYAAKIEKREADLDWCMSAETLLRRIRAFNPWPIAFTYLAGRRLRILKALFCSKAHHAAPGTILAVGPDGVDVATGTGVLRVIELQPADKRRMHAGEFARARDVVGSVLGHTQSL